MTLRCWRGTPAPVHTHTSSSDPVPAAATSTRARHKSLKNCWKHTKYTQHTHTYTQQNHPAHARVHALQHDRKIETRNKSTRVAKHCNTIAAKSKPSEAKQGPTGQPPSQPQPQTPANSGRGWNGGWGPNLAFNHRQTTHGAFFFSAPGPYDAFAAPGVWCIDPLAPFSDARQPFSKRKKVRLAIRMPRVMSTCVGNK